MADGCPERVRSHARDVVGHRCGRKVYQPTEGQPENRLGECKLHYNARHRIGKRYDAQRAKQAADDARRDRSLELIAGLGGIGRPDRNPWLDHNKGVVLTETEAEALIARLNGED